MAREWKRNRGKNFNSEKEKHPTGAKKRRKIRQSQGEESLQYTRYRLGIWFYICLYFHWNLQKYRGRDLTQDLPQDLPQDCHKICRKIYCKICREFCHKICFKILPRDLPRDF
jgi:hypothetical protein